MTDIGRNPDMNFDRKKNFTKVADLGTNPSGQEVRGRAGVLHTPHGDVLTPAFIPVGTKATVKAVLPESVREFGGQAVLSNAYHLYLQPGHDVIDEAGGLATFMNWHGPTFTDSGGFQVMSLGAGFKKVINMDVVDKVDDSMVATGKERLAHVDDDGVNFKSHLDGSMHRFTPESSMQIQHSLGADVMMAFDELTTLMNTRSYQETSLQRTYQWAVRCVREHARLTAERTHRPYQQLYGVIQGAQYEDLRRKACRDLSRLRVDGLDFDGFGIGGAIEKQNMGQIVDWCAQELPEKKPRHLLGISEPDDIFVGVENGADTFDCVSPTRVARNSAVYTPSGRENLLNASNKRNFSPIQEGCGCYTCQGYTRAYLNHLFKAKEMLAATLASIHNEYFIVRLVKHCREALIDGTFYEFKAEFMGQYYAKKASPLA